MIEGVAGAIDVEYRVPDRDLVNRLIDYFLMHSPSKWPDGHVFRPIVILLAMGALPYWSCEGRGPGHRYFDSSNDGPFYGPVVLICNKDSQWRDHVGILLETMGKDHWLDWDASKKLMSVLVATFNATRRNDRQHQIELCEVEDDADQVELQVVPLDKMREADLATEDRQARIDYCLDAKAELMCFANWLEGEFLGGNTVADLLDNGYSALPEGYTVAGAESDVRDHMRDSAAGEVIAEYRQKLGVTLSDKVLGLRLAHIYAREEVETSG